MHNCQTTFVGGINPFMLVAAPEKEGMKQPSKPRPPTPGSRSFAVLRAVDNSGVTFVDVSAKVGIERRKASHALNDLLHRGFIRATPTKVAGRPCNRYWIVESSEKKAPRPPAKERPVSVGHAPILEHIRLKKLVSQKEIYRDLDLGQPYVNYVVNRLLVTGHIELIEEYRPGNGPRKFYKIRELLQ